jgi:hypothetical protein
VNRLRPDLPRRPALLLTVVTGSTGLVYEVTWQRYLATLLGSRRLLEGRANGE